ncbi:flavin-containing monooxygenase [Methylibium sp.]|uniref:flavin-containing monooxygenase n=1 Tax=Methylibium sp. TaxID=2067992 RepID=UPI003D13FE89
MSVQDHAVLIIGAGFAGLGMAIRLQQDGIDDFAILERADAVGGTWRDNRYPGCACDVPSHLYSYSFEPNPHWTRAYAPWHEIRDYLEHCVRKYRLSPHLRFGAALHEARWDAAAGRWQVLTTDGRRYSAPVLIAGLGGLSNPALPRIDGMERFAGPSVHSAAWPDRLDLTGRRVAVIGTGASAIQLVPQLAAQAAHVDLYQRTPAWVLPKADRALHGWERRLFARWPLTQRLARLASYWQHEARAFPLLKRPQWLRVAEATARRHLARQISDPSLRTRLTPDYTLGCKRVLLSNDYYPALARPNVELVTDAIREITPHGVVTTDGRERAADVLVWCTGFRVQGRLPAGTVVGRDGQDLRNAWEHANQAYLGSSVAGFPNFFLLTGPNTGLGHSSMLLMIESQLAYIGDALRTLRERGLRSAEVRREVQDTYNEELQRRLAGTAWASGCHSWYLDRNGRNTVIWPGYTFGFRRRTRHFDAAAYRLEPSPR